MKKRILGFLLVSILVAANLLTSQLMVAASTMIFTTSSSDGYALYASTVWNTAWIAADGGVTSNSMIVENYQSGSL
jgi:hypothetical protein